jgi:hypothetical protein
MFFDFCKQLGALNAVHRAVIDRQLMYNFQFVQAELVVMLELVVREDKEKIGRLRKAMENEGVDALVLRLPKDVLYISGY